MKEYRINEFIVRVHTDRRQIEISQDHLDDHGNGGVFLAPEQLSQLNAYLQKAAKDLQDALLNESSGSNDP